MRTPLGPSRTSWSLDQTVSTSDILVVTRRHARVGLRTARCAADDICLLRGGDACSLTCEPRVPARPAGKGLMRGCPRMPSVVSTSLRAETHRPVARAIRIGKRLLPRTGSPFLRSCPASGGASSFLPASALRATTRPCDLPASKTRDASERLLPPVRLACTRTSRVSGSLPQLSLRGDPAEFGLCAV
jgi:hypothetical protein